MRPCWTFNNFQCTCKGEPVTNEITMLQDERRRHDRLGKRLSILYRGFEDIAKDKHAQRGELCDFSGGGARFLANQELHKGSQLILELDFVGWQEDGEEWVQTGNPADLGKLKAIGEVMWCANTSDQPTKHEVGVRFTGRIR
jgi:c-di-GMP-binding flagellar brake protein YcgR